MVYRHPETALQAGGRWFDPGSVHFVAEIGPPFAPGFFSTSPSPLNGASRSVPIPGGASARRLARPWRADGGRRGARPWERPFAREARPCPSSHQTAKGRSWRVGAALSPCAVPAFDTSLDQPSETRQEAVMIRFPCPGCGKMLKVAEGKGGGPVLCPRCGEQTVAPATVQGPEPASADEAPGLVSPLFSGPSLAMRWGIGSVAAVGLLGLVLAVLRLPLPGGEGEFDARWGLFMAGCSFALICA